VDAGSQIITTNTFGGTNYRLARENLESHVHEYNVAGARLARDVADAADHEVLVAGSVGPTGEIMEPLGHADAEGARAAFAQQAARWPRAAWTFSSSRP
jgi:5-methyltetrahydrofolate--homocysteine methyltransferase